MLYRIVHETRGRIRLRVGQYAFTEEEAASLAHHLRSQTGVVDAQTRAANGSILITYEKGCRNAVLEMVEGLSIADIPSPADNTAPDMGALTNKFQMSLGKAVGWHLAKKLLPPQIRAVMAVANAMPFVKEALCALAHRKLNVSVLDGVAISTSLIRRDFKTAASVMFLLKVSDILADYTQSRTRCALRQNMAICAESVWLVDGDQEIEVLLDHVRLGDVIHVRTGQLVPIDGQVVSGTAQLNEASMTGESTLVGREEGDSVFAGTAVEDGDLFIKTSSIPGQSRIDHIVDMVESSEEVKAALQSRAEKLADSLVPWSLGVFIADLIATRSLVRASSVLMVDYSCAIKLSTPIAVMSAMREATKRNVVVKGGKFLEQLAGADTIVFDKTGTLTTAQPVCHKVITFGSMSENACLRLAACLEEHFPHSVARAIVKAARERNLAHGREMHAEVNYIVAHGISSSVDGRMVNIGSAHFIFDDEGIERPEDLDKIIETEAPTSSVVFLSVDGKLEAALCIEDSLRSDAKAAIAGLKQRGFEHIVMLTGDSENCAAAIARELGITDYRSQVLPEDKATYVNKLKAAGHTVVMVGDGINDSPALAAADVSLAMSDASDIARSVADITLLRPTLMALLETKDIADSLIRRIEHSFAFIASFNTALIAAGLVGLMAPTMTAMLHNLSTVGLSALNMRPLLPEGSGSAEAALSLEAAAGDSSVKELDADEYDVYAEARA
mgnify:FL=1